jgi:hypothetical protein
VFASCCVCEIKVWGVFRLRNVITAKSKAIHVTGCGGLKGCEMLRIPHCLHNRILDGGKVVSPIHRPHFTPQKSFFFMFPSLISVRGQKD